MKITDLKNRLRDEQKRMIETCPKISLREVLDNPEFLGEKKSVVFIGNYAVFGTSGLCIRVVDYYSRENAWIVSDIDLSSMYGEMFLSPFSKSELRESFELAGDYVSDTYGYLLDKH